MAASRLAALGIAVLAVAPSSAFAGGESSPDDPVVVVDSPNAAVAHPLAERFLLSAPVAREPVDVSVCEGWSCDLIRVHRVGPEGVVLEQHLPLGPFWPGVDATRMVTATRKEGAHGSHAVALFGHFEEAAPLAATVTRAGSANPPLGGVTPYEATELLSRQPELAVAFAAVVVAPDAPIEEPLLRALLRLVDKGGAVMVPRARGHLFTRGEIEEPLVADPATMLVELGSTRSIVDGRRELRATVVRRVGAIVLYDEDAISPSAFSDALLAAIPRFAAQSRVAGVGPNQTPASQAAGLAVSRVGHPGVLFLPIGLALLLVIVALQSRSRRGAFLTRPFVGMAIASTAALLIVPRLVDGGGAEAEVRTYVTFGEAQVALEEGAVAERPGASGGVVSLTAPIGAFPVADVRGVALAGPVVIDVSDGGRTLRFDVHGDGAGVASWTRVVSLPGGLHVVSTGGWPSAVEELVVENRLPFALVSLAAVDSAGRRYSTGALAPGQRASSWKLVGEPWEETAESDDDTRALAERRLFEGMRQRCHSWAAQLATIACVIGVGVAQDGALVGVQVLSP